MFNIILSLSLSPQAPFHALPIPSTEKPNLSFLHSLDCFHDQLWLSTALLFDLLIDSPNTPLLFVALIQLLQFLLKELASVSLLPLLKNTHDVQFSRFSMPRTISSIALSSVPDPVRSDSSSRHFCRLRTFQCRHSASESNQSAI